ncbi:MAG TPA: Trk system potassium transporter TrkA [Candidatus Onthocola gallistercoris]|mgnify:CR=1 FL=1|uniref:Trk system potassium uptake protein TrkA n=1 Tax=Candidatus Onthocola gallistercoris TaxID=2840876 RepID=A0A9D1HFP3_9FIRM|nr:Trk system potassium transporter TrkA [Candidatus Onthocola gallistercoris]
MNIIIVGCGKVGSNLTELLINEDHNITVIDTREKKVAHLTENFDVMGYVGNGASIDTLTEANIQETDILIAVTGSDETNLLMCLMAKKAARCHTIARVRNPMYNREIDFIKAQMGISMIINPELAAANEIFQLLRFPSAYKIDAFSSGKVQLFKILIQNGQVLDGLEVKDLSSVCNCDVLVCTVERGDNVTIPGGNFRLKEGDLITVIASQDNMIAFFRKLNLSVRQARNTLIIGGGTIGYYLAKRLLDAHIKVRIIENDPDRCEQLAEDLPEASIINGDGSDKQLLIEEGLSRAESFVTLTNVDEENILLSMFAQRHSKAKTVTKINRLAFDEIVESLNIGSVVYPKYITADYILQYVRALQNSVGNRIARLYHIMNNRVEAIEFSISESSPVTDVPLMNLNLKDNQLICCINRNGKIIIPRGQDTIRIGDSVIIVTLEKGLQDVRDILKG